MRDLLLGALRFADRTPGGRTPVLRGLFARTFGLELPHFFVVTRRAVLRRLARDGLT